MPSSSDSPGNLLLEMKKACCHQSGLCGVSYCVIEKVNSLLELHVEYVMLLFCFVEDLGSASLYQSYVGDCLGSGGDATRK